MLGYYGILGQKVPPRKRAKTRPAFSKSQVSVSQRPKLAILAWDFGTRNGYGRILAPTQRGEARWCSDVVKTKVACRQEKPDVFGTQDRYCPA